MAAFVLFEMLVKPFIYKLMGHTYRPLDVRMPLEEPLINKKVKRQKWWLALIFLCDYGNG